MKSETMARPRQTRGQKCTIWPNLLSNCKFSDKICYSYGHNEFFYKGQFCWHTLHQNWYAHS